MDPRNGANKTKAAIQASRETSCATLNRSDPLLSSAAFARPN
jgi:hypothetical protein